MLALFLSFSETLGKSAQTEAVDANVKSSDSWAFFQAKDIRRTTCSTAAEQTQLLGGQHDRSRRQGRDRQADRRLAQDRRALRTGTEDRRRPQGTCGAGQGQEKERDLAVAKYHHYEIASAAFQVGIVLASATVITGIVALAWFAGALGVIGLALLALGLFAPYAMALV